MRSVIFLSVMFGALSACAQERNSTGSVLTKATSGMDPEGLRESALELFQAGYQRDAQREVQKAIALDKSAHTQFVELLIASHNLDLESGKLEARYTDFKEEIAKLARTKEISASLARKLDYWLGPMLAARLNQDLEKSEYWPHVSEKVKKAALALKARRKEGTTACLQPKGNLSSSVPVIPVAIGDLTHLFAVDTGYSHSLLDKSNLNYSQYSDLANEPVVKSSSAPEYYLIGTLRSSAKSQYFASLPKYQGSYVTGVLGMNHLNAFSVYLGFEGGDRGGVRKVGISTSPPPTENWDHAIPMVRGRTGRCFVPGSVDGRIVNLRVDTGATARGQTETKKCTVVVDGRTFEDISMDVSDPVVSMDILSQFTNVCFDFPRLKLYLTSLPEPSP